MSSTALLRKVRARSWGERGLAIEAGVALALARLALRVVPFRQIAGWLRLAAGETLGEGDAATEARAEGIGWAIAAAAAHTPWHGTCLMQGLAGAAMLRRRRLPATLYLGVAVDGSAAAGLSAHAWLRCGTAVITGVAGRERFTVVGSYRTTTGS